MEIENKKIIKATKLELFDIFIKQKLYYVISYKKYLKIMKEYGCKIIESDSRKLFWKSIKFVICFPYIVLKAWIKQFKKLRRKDIPLVLIITFIFTTMCIIFSILLYICLYLLGL